MSGKRRYEAPARTLKAAATRHAVLAAARSLFTQKGYSATSVAELARTAGVNLDTVYAAVGRKPQIMKALIEAALSGSDEAVPATQRDYVARITAARGAREKLTIYADAIGQIQPRLAPIFLCLSEAGRTDADCAALWAEISARRAGNMLDLAADLRATGELRADLTDQAVADIIWSLNGPEYYVLLVHQRGWTPEQFAAWLADAWIRLLLSGGT
jgi:AcrR family transcriptional regulator